MDAIEKLRALADSSGRDDQLVTGLTYGDARDLAAELTPRHPADWHRVVWALNVARENLQWTENAKVKIEMERLQDALRALWSAPRDHRRDVSPNNPPPPRVLLD